MFANLQTTDGQTDRQRQGEILNTSNNLHMYQELQSKTDTSNDTDRQTEIHGMRHYSAAVSA